MKASLSIDHVRKEVATLFSEASHRSLDQLSYDVFLAKARHHRTPSKMGY